MLAPLNAPSSSAVAGGWHGVESTFAAARPLIDPGRQPQSQGGPPSGPVTSYVVAGRGVLEAVVTYNNTRASHLARACSCSLVFALLAPLLVSFAPATNPWIGACNPLQVYVLLWRTLLCRSPSLAPILRSVGASALAAASIASNVPANCVAMPADAKRPSSRPPPPVSTTSVELLLHQLHDEQVAADLHGEEMDLDLIRWHLARCRRSAGRAARRPRRPTRRAPRARRSPATRRARAAAR